MADKPILFSGPMVRAILAGRKTMTRRIIDPQPVEPVFLVDDWYDAARERVASIYAGEKSIVKYQIGDRLWVREAWRFDGAARAVSADACRGKRAVQYRADGYVPIPTDERSPIFMPRWASRITLLVTGVKVERLQEISEADAVAEGCELRESVRGLNVYHASHRASFASMWTIINGPGAWKANPWVAAYSFQIETRKEPEHG
jgi:hypothetical protein